MRLLPRDALVRTGPVDRADWNYHPVLRHIQRRRFRMLQTLLGMQRYARVLEIGYGSGVFMPELDTRADAVCGVDLHDKPAEVAASLAAHGVTAELKQGSVTEIPFPAGHFDALVSVSTLEYVDDMPGACAEMIRVLRPEGVLVVVTPGHSILADVGLRILTGTSAAENYASRREVLRDSLLARFHVEEELRWPALGGRLLKLYTALRLRPR